jgi:hypothetical protein
VWWCEGECTAAERKAAVSSGGGTRTRRWGRGRIKEGRRAGRDRAQGELKASAAAAASGYRQRREAAAGRRAPLSRLARGEMEKERAEAPTATT